MIYQSIIKGYGPRWARWAELLLGVSLPLIILVSFLTPNDGFAWRFYLGLAWFAAAVLMAGAWCVGALAYLNRVIKRADDHCCIHCGHSLADNDTDICLECGQPIDPARAWIATREAHSSQNRSAE